MALTVSVIVPVKNDAQRLEILLKSLAEQTVLHELIVVDNGSEDTSVIVATNAGAKVLYCPGLKVGALRNRGVTQAAGDYLAFIDSDHEVPKDWLETGLSAFQGSKVIGAVGAPCLPPPNGSWVQRVWGIHRLRGNSRSDVDWLGAGNFFVRRAAFLAVGGFNENLVAAEDVDLCHRLRRFGLRVVLDRQIKNIHHGEPRRVVDFIRKEYWRGSSGVRAWFSQGCPVSDLPSLLWPIWHLLFGFSSLVFLGSYLLSRSNGGYLMFLITFVLFLLPAVVLSYLTCLMERQMKYVIQLAVLYCLYGIARSAALWK